MCRNIGKHTIHKIYSVVTGGIYIMVTLKASKRIGY